MGMQHALAVADAEMEPEMRGEMACNESARPARFQVIQGRWRAADYFLEPSRQIGR